MLCVLRLDDPSPALPLSFFSHFCVWAGVFGRLCMKVTVRLGSTRPAGGGPDLVQVVQVMGPGRRHICFSTTLLLAGADFAVQIANVHASVTRSRM